MKTTTKIDFIAEIGSNWYAPGQNGLERAKKLIKSAAGSGATAVKFQYFKADKLYREPQKAYSLKHLELPYVWLPELKQTAVECGVEFICTPFFIEAVAQLLPFVQRFKIASWDLTYTPLLEEIAKTGYPVILSTGAAFFQEIDNAVDIFPEAKNITLLHCTGGYPTEPKDMVLRRIVDLAEEFYPVHVGLSSHCLIPSVTAASVLYGAEVIEVHYDLQDKLGAETGHSYTPQRFEEMVKMAKLLLEAKDCGCEQTLTDAVARNSYYRDESDWLRPVLNPQ